MPKHPNWLRVFCLLTPAWWVFGRVLLGQPGWLWIMGTFASPVVALLLLGLTWLFTSRPDVASSRHLKSDEAASLWALHGAMWLFTVAVPDGGDIGGSYSILSTRFGDGANAVGDPLAVMSGLVIPVLLLFNLVVGLRRRRWARQDGLPPV